MIEKQVVVVTKKTNKLQISLGDNVNNVIIINSI